MPDDIRDILVEIIDSYGIKILEDPDRLAQFLEDRSSLRPEDTFHLTFALRFLLKCGWRPSRREYMKEGADYRASLESQLGFTKEQAAEVMKLINWLMEMEYGGSEGEAETGAVVAVPGNLKKIAGGVANRPRTMRIRKKSLYNGLILIVVARRARRRSSFRSATRGRPRATSCASLSSRRCLGLTRACRTCSSRRRSLRSSAINSRGLSRGEYRLKVIGYDLPADPAGGGEGRRERHEATGACSSWSSGAPDAAKTLAPLADELEAPLVVAAPEPLDGPLLDESSLPYLYSFSLVNDAASRGKILSYFATQALHKKKIAFYYDPSDAVSSAVYKSARKWAAGFGAEVVAELPYGRGGGHYAAMRAFAESGADLLMLPGRGRRGGRDFAPARSRGLRSGRARRRLYRQAAAAGGPRPRRELVDKRSLRARPADKLRAARVPQPIQRGVPARRRYSGDTLIRRRDVDSLGLPQHAGLPRRGYTPHAACDARPCPRPHDAHDRPAHTHAAQQILGDNILRGGQGHLPAPLHDAPQLKKRARRE